MKKRIISFTILVISFFCIFSVKAATEFNQAGVNQNLEKYKNAVLEITASNCSGNLYTTAAVNNCNTLELNKTRALTYLFNAKSYNKDLIDDEVQKVLDANSTTCTNFVSNELQSAINKIFILFYIAGPILLILFGSLDLTSAIVAGDEKKRKAAYRKFIRRTISLVLLFAAPVLVNLLINIFGMNKMTSNRYTCTFTPKKITISYVSRKKSKKGNAKVAQAILDAADKIKSVSADKSWSYGYVGAAGILNNYKNNSYGEMCCADYVSAVLVLADVFTLEEINGMGSYNQTHCSGYDRGNTFASGVHAFLHEHDWIRITDIDDLQPGDITFYWPQSNTPRCLADAGITRAGHVEIYAGDNTTYSGGSTDSIRTKGTTGHTPSYSGEHKFIEAYRYPGSSSSKR